MLNEYKKLRVWELAREQFREVYEMTKHFPKEDRYGIVTQMRRSALSVPSNIAEGVGFRSGKQRVKFLEIAHGSSCEIESQLINCDDVGLLNPDRKDKLLDRADHITRMLRKLLKVELTKLEKHLP